MDSFWLYVGLMPLKLVIKYKIHVYPWWSLSGVGGRSGIWPKNYGVKPQSYVGIAHSHKGNDQSHEASLTLNTIKLYLSPSQNNIYFMVADDNFKL